MGLLQEVEQLNIHETVGIAQDVDLGAVAQAGERVLGSDAWLEKIMNFEKETAALRDFRAEFDKQSSHLSGQEAEAEFLFLLKRWLRLQHEFYLTENGAGKYMKFQPSYGFHVWLEDNHPWVCPDDLRKFGDQAKRYVEADEVVGKGLVHAYKQLFNLGAGAMTGIVSPTEMYQDYASGTDVLNFLWVTEGERGSEVKRYRGKYVVLNQVLSPSERRFIHNAFYLLGSGFDVEHVLTAELEQPGFIHDQELWMHEVVEGLKEHEQLVSRPNSFMLDADIDDLKVVELVEQVSGIFERRYGRALVTDDDVSMYPIVASIVDRYLDSLVSALWTHPHKGEYYTLLREMVYGSQRQWVRRNPLVSEWHYMQDLMMGRVAGGLEVGWGGGGDFGYTSLDWWGGGRIAGEVGREYCKTHRTFYYGNECPKCKKSH